MSCAYGKEFIVTWFIENYSFCSHENGDVIESPFFRTECLGGSKWKLHLVPRDLNGDKEVTQCFLKRYDKNGDICIDYKIEMLDPSGTVLETAEGENENFPSPCDSDSTLEIESSKLDVQQWSENTLTLRCRMRSGGPHPQPAIGCEVRTKIGIESQIFFWELSLPLIDTVHKEFLILEKTKLKAELSKSGISCNEAICIKMSKIESDSPLQRLVSCTITLRDVQGEVIKCSSGTHFFKSKLNDDVWDFPPFLTSLDFDKYSRERKKVTLQFEFSVTNGMQSETPSNFQYSTNADSLLILQSDMRELFLNQKHTDVTLQLDENTTLPAHKSVLIARSHVFSQMFDHPEMIESKTNTIKVVEDKITMHALLEYLYTGTVEKMDYDIAKKLMMAADKYLVFSLKDKCATYLMNGFSIINVCEILKFADDIGHQQLKTAALDYIAVHVKEIMPLAEWSMVAEKHGLVGDVLSTVVQKFKMVPNTAKAGVRS